jgi:acetyltransferase-like isoleucine patch superfamily enzyme
MRKTIRRFIRKLVLAVIVPLRRLSDEFAESDLPEFGNTPKNLIIELPRRIYDADKMFIGDNVLIGPGALLVAQTHYPTEVMQHPQEPQPVQTFNPRITIGDRVTSTGGLTLAAMREITIEDDVMFASNVMVSDGLHGFDNANEPYKYQRMCKIAPVKIGRGCWIGQNVVIMPGVTIGELSIVGANSVVTRSIPARTIAVGAPVKVIKQWDEATQRWVICE